MTYIRRLIWVYIYTIIKWVLWLMIIYIRTPIAHRTSLTLHNSANFNKPGLKEWRNRFHGGITKTLPHLYYRVISFYYRHSWWFLMGRENLEYGLLIAYNSLMEFCLIYITNFVIDVIYNLLHFCYKLLVKLLGRPFYISLNNFISPLGEHFPFSLKEVFFLGNFTDDCIYLLCPIMLQSLKNILTGDT